MLHLERESLNGEGAVGSELLDSFCSWKGGKGKCQKKIEFWICQLKH